MRSLVLLRQRCSCSKFDRNAARTGDEVHKQRCAATATSTAGRGWGPEVGQPATERPRQRRVGQGGIGRRQQLRRGQSSAAAAAAAAGAGEQPAGLPAEDSPDDRFRERRADVRCGRSAPA